MVIVASFTGAAAFRRCLGLEELLARRSLFSPSLSILPPVLFSGALGDQYAYAYVLASVRAEPFVSALPSRTLRRKELEAEPRGVLGASSFSEALVRFWDDVPAVGWTEPLAAGAVRPGEATCASSVVLVGEGWCCLSSWSSGEITGAAARSSFASLGGDMSASLKDA